MIFVVGTGRSATSTVARILDEQLEINMGGKREAGIWPMPRDGLGDTYEDIEFSTVNRKALDGDLDERGMHLELVRLGKERTEPWGTKCPAIAEFLPRYRVVFPTARWVWCQRSPSLVLRSLMRVRPAIPAATHKDMIADRLLALGCELPRGLYRTLEMHFSEPRSEAFIVDRLRLWLEMENP